MKLFKILGLFAKCNGLPFSEFSLGLYGYGCHGNELNISPQISLFGSSLMTKTAVLGTFVISFSPTTLKHHLIFRNTLKFLLESLKITNGYHRNHRLLWWKLEKSVILSSFSQFSVKLFKFQGLFTKCNSLPFSEFLLGLYRDGCHGNKFRTSP